MRRAALVVNPASGRARSFLLRRTELEAVLSGEGFAAEWRETSAASGSAEALAAEAVAAGCEVVFACGGDGTVHGVLQAVAGTGVAMGVLPAGTANALARNLRLPLDPARALQASLHGRARMLPLGRGSFAGEQRWFAVMAGAGPDGALVHALPRGQKRLMGRAAYYAGAARLFCTRRFPPFRVRVRCIGGDEEELQAVAMMASRVENLGGLFRGLTPGCALHHPHLRVHMLRAPAAVSLPTWFGLRSRSPWLRVVEAEMVRCTDVDRTVLTQVDGEATGSLPMELSVTPDALRLLVPAGTGGPRNA